MRKINLHSTLNMFEVQNSNKNQQKSVNLVEIPLTPTTTHSCPEEMFIPVASHKIRKCKPNLKHLSASNFRQTHKKHSRI